MRFPAAKLIIPGIGAAQPRIYALATSEASVSSSDRHDTPPPPHRWMQGRAEIPGNAFFRTKQYSPRTPQSPRTASLLKAGPRSATASPTALPGRRCNGESGSWLYSTLCPSWVVSQCRPVVSEPSAEPSTTWYALAGRVAVPKNSATAMASCGESTTMPISVFRSFER